MTEGEGYTREQALRKQGEVGGRPSPLFIPTLSASVSAGLRLPNLFPSLQALSSPEHFHQTSFPEELPLSQTFSMPCYIKVPSPVFTFRFGHFLFQAPVLFFAYERALPQPISAFLTPNLLKHGTPFTCHSSPKSCLTRHIINAQFSSIYELEMQAKVMSLKF